MKRKILITLFKLALVLGGTQFVAAQGTAFSYQGRLSVGDNSTNNGSYDFQFQVFDTASVGTGSSYGSPNPNNANAVAVSNGLFTVTLDFGTGVFTGPARWLQISVRTNGVGTYTTLNPRQALTPTPYAIYAGNAAQLGGQGATAYVAKAGDTMTGALNLPADGLILGGNQLVASSGNVGIGTATPGPFKLNVAGNTKLGNNMTIGRSGGQYDEIGYNVGYTGASDIYTYFKGDKAASIRLGYNGIEFRTAPSGSAGTPLTLNNRMTITQSGNVGIGTTIPSAKLEVNGNIIASPNDQGNPGNIVLTAGSVDGTALYCHSYGLPFHAHNDFTGTDVVLAGGQAAGFTGGISVSGNVGIGTTTPGYALDVVGRSRIRDGNGTAGLWFNTAHGFGSGGVADIGFVGVLDPTRIGFYGNDPRGGSGWGLTFDTVTGNVGIGTGTSYPTSKLRVNGDASVCTLTITGGCDLSEPFHMSSTNMAAGSVVVIDEEHPGKLKLSEHVFDSRVAGIISGANGVNPGISMHQEGLLEGGQNVALSGRVYALADASESSINPGDLLTTSATPSHCMKVTNSTKAQGAIIGKAMSALAEGKGMVLVLVSLQ